MIEGYCWDEGGVDFRLASGGHRRLTALDLWDCAPFQFDAQTGQRILDPANQPAQARLLAVSETAVGWRVLLQPGGPVEFRPTDLAPYLQPQPVQPERIPWETPRSDWVLFDYGAVLGDRDQRRRCLLQVARSGFARLVGAPNRPGEVERLIGAFGQVRETNYGRMFDVRVKRDAANLADTDRGLAPHTDNPYRTSVPALQALHCLEASDEGGETRLIDGLAAALRLRSSRPEAFELLWRTPVRFGWRDAATSLDTCEPLISLNGRGGITAIRLNHRSFKAIDAEPEVRDAWREAYRALLGVINDAAFGYEFKLSAGEIMLFDNHRILHGRTAYASSGSGERHLQGAYAEADGLYSTLRILTEGANRRREGG